MGRQGGLREFRILLKSLFLSFVSAGNVFNINTGRYLVSTKLLQLYRQISGEYQITAVIPADIW